MRAQVLFLSGLISGCQACATFDTPKPYQCERSGPATQCPGGWRCGLDGFCFDPTLARPTTCESDADCAQSWRCGTPVTGAPSTARVCRARGVGAAFTCTSDLDCEGTWRCGPAGVCLDTTREALREASAPSLSPSRVSSLLDTTDAVEVSVSNRFSDESGCRALASGLEVVTVTSRSGGVQRVWFPGEVPPGVSFDCDAGLTGSANGLRRPARLERFSLDAGVVVATAQLDGTTLVVFDGGVSCAISPRGDTRCEDLGFPAHAVRISETGFAVLTGRDGFRIWTVDGGSSPLLTVEGAPSLNVVVPVTTTSGFVLAAATSVGLAQAPVRPDGRQNSDGGWPVASSWDYGPQGVRSCRDGGIAALDVRADTASGLVLVSIRNERADGIGVSLLESTPSLNCGLILEPRTSFSRFCAEGTSLLWGAAGSFSNRTDATSELRCRVVDGGLEVGFGDATASSTRPSTTLLFAQPMFDRRMLFARSNPLRSVALSPSGTLWHQAGASYQPLLLDRLPLGPWTSTDGGEAPEFLLRSRPLAGSTLGTKATVGGGVFSLVEGLGLVLSEPDRGPFVAVSAEQPDLALISLPFFSTSEQQAVVSRTLEGINLLAGTTALDTFSPPFRLTPQRTTDGGTLILLSAFDALLSAEVTEVLSRPFDFRRSLPDVPELRVRTVPLSRSPITALLALTPTPDEAGRVRLSEGYVITSGRVFRFEGDNETVWRSRELEMPFGEPFALVAQQERARVGYRTGEVYSLPSRVLLAPALDSARLEDLTVHCGRIVGLSADALWTLAVAAGQAQGTWQRTALPTTAGPGAIFARLSGDLLVVSTDGRTQRAGLTCR